jgi:hypothetical protein
MFWLERTKSFSGVARLVNTSGWQKATIESVVMVAQLALAEFRVLAKMT